MEFNDLAAACTHQCFLLFTVQCQPLLLSALTFWPALPAEAAALSHAGTMLPYFSHWHHLSIFLKTDPGLGACSSLLPSNGLACSVLALLVSAYSYVRPESCTLVQGLFLVDTVRTQGSHFPAF